MGVFQISAHLCSAWNSTFPLGEQKKPAVKQWGKIGLPASASLATRFTESHGLAFVTDQRNGVAIVDVDSVDERVLADALARHSETLIIVRTTSGKFHLYYRFNGELRLIRPFEGLPIDILGIGATNKKTGKPGVGGSLSPANMARR